MQSLTKRSNVLFKFRELAAARAGDLARVITAEHGKTVEDARGEVQRGLEVVEFACGAAHLMKGEASEAVATGVDSHSLRQPLGVAVGITPFNFPAMVPMWMYPLALACGNAFILKPSEKDPSASLLVAEWLAEAGLPDGVFNVVHGDVEAVKALLCHPGVDSVSFVGSTPVAKSIYETATAHGKRVQALGGAKNHAVVMPDADVDIAADAIASAAYGSAGQRCMAISAVVAVGPAGDALAEALDARVDAVQVGPGAEDGSDMGPLVTGAARDRVLSAIEAGVGEGADLRRDGRGLSVSGHDEGFWVGPTLFDRVTPEMSIYRDEIFGPVLVVLRAEDVRGRARPRQPQPVRQRRGDLHDGRPHRARVRVPRAGRHGRRQRADPGADGVLLVRRLEAVAVRRPARARARGRVLLHARQGRHGALARAAQRRRLRVPGPQVTLTQTRLAAVIFDCDGTLVDSEPLARVAWERSLAPHGYGIDDDEYAGLIGLPFLRVHGFFAERIPGLSAPDTFWESYSGELFGLIDTRLEVFSDALETVRGVRERGLAVAVASSSPRARLDRTLARAGLSDTFAVTVAGDEIARGKPAPDMFLAAAEQLGVEPARCAAIEDSPPGVAAGLAAGMHTVGIARDPADAAGLGDAHVVLDRLSADAVLAADDAGGHPRRSVSRQPSPSRSAANVQPASAATAATSIGASGSVASTMSADPGRTADSARRAFTAGSGQARPRASSVVFIRS